jgi:glutaconate CoA-transferase subunit B
VNAHHSVAAERKLALRPDPETKELSLVALHPRASVEQAREATGWVLRVAEDLGTTESPTEQELRALRELYARTAAARKEGAG